MNKEKFCKIINRLKEADELRTKVDDLFQKSRENIENDFCNAAGLQICHEGVVVELLEEIMNDEESDIAYFIYDLDYGRKAGAHECITDPETGEKISLRTAEELYSYLIQNTYNHLRSMD